MKTLLFLLTMTALLGLGYFLVKKVDKFVAEGGVRPYNRGGSKKEGKDIGMNIVFLLRPKATVAFLYNGSTIRQGLEKMRVHGYTAIPVISKEGAYVGTVSEGDFLWHMMDQSSFEWKAQEAFRVDDIIRKGWNPAVKIDATMDDLLLRVTEQNFVPVVDDRNAFMGIITRKDVIKYFYEKERTEESLEENGKEKAAFFRQGARP